MSKTIITHVNNRDKIKDTLNKNQLEFYDFLKNSFPNEMFEMVNKETREINGESVDITISRDNVFIDDLFLAMVETIGYSKHLAQKMSYLYDIDYIIGSMEYYLDKEELIDKDVIEYNSTAALLVLYLSNHGQLNLIERLTQGTTLVDYLEYLKKLDGNIIKHKTNIQTTLNILKSRWALLEDKLKLVLLYKDDIKYAKDSTTSMQDGKNKINIINDKTVYNSNLFFDTLKAISFNINKSDLINHNNKYYINTNLAGISMSTKFLELRREINNLLYPITPAGMPRNELIEVDFDLPDIPTPTIEQSIVNGIKQVKLIFNQVYENLKIQSSGQQEELLFEYQFYGETTSAVPIKTTENNKTVITFNNIQIPSNYFNEYLTYNIAVKNLGNIINYNYDNVIIADINYTTSVEYNGYNSSSGVPLNRVEYVVNHIFTEADYQKIDLENITTELEYDNTVFTCSTPTKSWTTTQGGDKNCKVEIAIDLTKFGNGLDLNKKVDIKTTFKIKQDLVSVVGVDEVVVNNTMDAIAALSYRKLPTPQHNTKTYSYTQEGGILSTTAKPKIQISYNKNLDTLLGAGSSAMAINFSNNNNSVFYTSNKNTMLINIHNETYENQSGKTTAQYKLVPFIDSNVSQISYDLPEYLFSGRERPLELKIEKVNPTSDDNEFKIVSKPLNLPLSTSIDKIKTRGVSYAYTTHQNFTQDKFIEDEQTYVEYAGAGISLNDGFWLDKISNVGVGVIDANHTFTNVFVYVNKKPATTELTVQQLNMPQIIYLVDTILDDQIPDGENIEIDITLSNDFIRIRFGRKLVVGDI